MGGSLKGASFRRERSGVNACNDWRNTRLQGCIHVRPQRQVAHHLAVRLSSTQKVI